ncbi:MAG TPA: ATP-binding protein [Arenimonas sp.]|uniref:hybrid sensor histidine kinase/response regulator n=1 Tax=Arenimonas sp. TaxID=1872635 RepID=UPI002D7FCF5A|nr:ATP-binding protein [Arenimonas sp.]HEU0154373.1 ATP-binding protein [Arenimonas sp.]
MTRPWQDWSLPRKTVAVVAGPLLLLFGSVLAIYLLERQTARAEADVRATLALVSDLHEAHSQLAETAAAVRGFLLVRRDNFLDPYRIAEPQLLATVSRLSERTRDGPRAERYARLLPLFQLKLTGWRELLREGVDPDDPGVRAQLVEGKQTLDILRAELRELGALERNELNARADAAAVLRQRNTAVTLAVALLGGLGAVAAAAGLAASLSRRLRRLAAEANRLGEGLPPREGRVAGDEIGQVDQRLREAGALLQARARQLDDARQQAEAANRAKDEFLSRMSHELRTPLNAMLGYAQLLTDTPDATPARRYGGHIEVAGRHLLGLITEMLDVAAIEAGSLGLEPRPLRLAPALQEALSLVQPQAAGRGITLVPPDAAGTALAVHADAKRLRQVLLNLLGNAAKYGPPGGRVQLAAVPHGRCVEISVKDDGPGLAPEAVARLFRPFERIDSTARGVEGTGLGLALSKRLVEAMGGEIGVDTAPGQGCRFWFRLPLAAEAPEDVDAGRTLATPATGPRQLLLVEDNASNRALVHTLLERYPQWQLATAVDAAGGERALRAGGIDLVLLDLHLPDGDGAALLAQLSAEGVALPPAIVLTADATAQARERALRAGAAAVLTKPLDLRQFHQELARCLR